MVPLGQSKINEIYDDEYCSISSTAITRRYAKWYSAFRSSRVWLLSQKRHIERMKENLEMFDNEMEILRALDKGQPLIGNPQNPDFVSSSVNW